MESLLQVLEVCLRGLLRHDELKCWTLHISIVRLLRGNEEWTDEVLQRLTDDTLLWKTQMVRLYGKTRERRKAKKKGKKGNARKQARTETEEVSKPLSLVFPNFETCEHWADTIKFIGPPKFQDTMLWEERHLAAKRLSRRTNQRNLTRDVLSRVWSPPSSLE
jgi:hypothetical protein